VSEPVRFGAPLPLEGPKNTRMHLEIPRRGAPEGGAQHGLYPVVGGFLDMVGGLELARDFSLVCMLGVTAIGYAVTVTLFGRRAAVFASAGYASTGWVLFVGGWRRSMPCALLLIASARALAIHGGMGRRPWGVLEIGPLAILAKYAALLFILPVFALLACLGVPFLGWWRAIARCAGSGGVSRSASGRLRSLTNRDVILKALRVDLFLHAPQMGGRSCCWRPSACC
jgi:hypothetical protein